MNLNNSKSSLGRFIDLLLNKIMIPITKIRVFGDFSRGTQRLFGKYFCIKRDLNPSQTRRCQ